MKPHSLLGIAAIGMMVVSCYPYDDYQRRKIGRAPQGTTAQQQVQPNPQLPAVQNPQVTQTEAPVNPPAGPQSVQVNPPQEQVQAPAPTIERKDYPFANKIPGKNGFVFSPYNNKVVDVRDIPTGTLVQDPTFPASEKKYFRVP
ncbi:MAG: hypothetical protein ACO3RV_09300 [Luteolibacter sp.]